MSMYEVSSFIEHRLTEWIDGKEIKTEKYLIPFRNECAAMVSLSFLPEGESLKISFHVDCSNEIHADYSIHYADANHDYNYDFKSNDNEYPEHSFDEMQHSFHEYYQKQSYFDIICRFTLKFKDLVDLKSRRICLADALYENRQNADYYFLVEKVKIPIDKLILKTVSPVYKAMFEKEKLIEYQQGYSDITDFNLETIEFIVNLIYDKSIPTEVNIDVLLEAYRFANKYQIYNVFDRLNERLRNELNYLNFVKITNFAYKCEFKELIQICIYSEVVNPFDQSKILDIFQLNARALKDVFLKPKIV